MRDGSEPVVEPTNGKVKLTAKGARNGTSIDWSLDVQEIGPPDGKVTRIEVPRQSGACQVTIKVKMDNPDLKLDPNRPLSASEGSCPPAGSGISTDQIDPASISVDGQGKRLTFTNKNTRPAQINYALNFVGAEPFDPMIINRVT